MIKSIINLILKVFGNLLRYIQITFIRLNGVKIGKGCMISLRAKIDTRRGRIVIGDNCVITYGCVILSHDRSAKHINPEDNGSGSVTLGNNVYIGVNSVVLRNVTIGDNTVVGAGSIVTCDMPSNSVVVGNPARVIKNFLPRD